MSLFDPEEKAAVEAKVQQQFDQKNIPHRVTLAESSEPVRRSDILTNEIYDILTEAERVRLSFHILNDQRFSQMTTANKMLPASEFARVDPKETFLDFLKRHEIFQELVALHSKSRAVLKMK